jgi:hypothetical protein
VTWLAEIRDFDLPAEAPARFVHGVVLKGYHTFKESITPGDLARALDLHQRRVLVRTQRENSRVNVSQKVSGLRIARDRDPHRKIVSEGPDD